MPGERLHKVLARAGLGSRRLMETWIEGGRISINGKIAGLGDSIQPGDDVRVDGQLVPSDRLFKRLVRVIGYHKPAGKVCTRSDEQGRPTVYEDLPSVRGGRWISIGRLDYNTSGLLLLTTDGEIAHRLMHPSTGVEREYAVRVLGEAKPEVLSRLRAGVQLEDGPARFESIVDAGGQGANHWYHVTLREGRNREVRRLWESQALTVSRLIRVRYGPLPLPRNQRAGKWWELEPAEVDALLAVAGVTLDADTQKARVKRDAAVTKRKRVGARSAKRPAQARHNPRAKQDNEWTSTRPNKQGGADDRKRAQSSSKKRGKRDDGTRTQTASRSSASHRHTRSNTPTRSGRKPPHRST